MRISDWSSDLCSSDLVVRLALRHAFNHVEQDDVAEFLLRGEQRQRSADIPGSDQSDLLASHGARHSFVASPALVQRPAGARANAPLRRSEEHTSELQSLMRISYAVFCLQKKNHTPPP